MHKLYKILLMSLLVLSTMSCNDDHEPEQAKTAEKTIIVFMPYSGNLYNDLLGNLNSMKNAIVKKGGLNNTRLVAFVAKDKQNGALIDIKYSKGVCRQDTLEKYTTPTYLTIEGRVQMLNKIKQYAPAKKYAMIVGCHGMGWIPKGTSFSQIKQRYFGGLSTDCQIDIDDFAASIMAADMKMQFILFDDCYMSCIEVAYDLKETTDYIIASTSEIMQDGMPYSRIYPYLMTPEPDYQAVCNEFYDFYSKSSTPYGTIGVTDCRYIDEMAAVMKNINSTHSFDYSLVSSVQDLDGDTFDPTIFFDFDDYVRKLCTGDDAAYRQFSTVMQQLVPYKATTDEIYSGNRQTPTRVSHFSGITISDLSTRTDISNVKQSTNWWVQTHSFN